MVIPSSTRRSAADPEANEDCVMEIDHDHYGVFSSTSYVLVLILLCAEPTTQHCSS